MSQLSEAGGRTWSGTVEAEHDVASLWTGDGADVVAACTHFAASTSTVLVTVEVADGRVQVQGNAGPQDLDRARTLHAERRGGRLFVFPGHTSLVGVMTVGELLTASAIDQVVMIGQREQVPDEQRIDTQSFVRPDLVDGVTRLLVRPAAGGVVVPFEQPNPTPCCADH